MTRFRTLLSRLAALFRRHHLDSALDEELRAHIDLATAENMTLGMNRKQARREALRSFGGVTQVKETYRQRRGFPFLDQVARDLRFALRQLHRAPGFAVTAIVTLALGLGANTAIFSIINALLLRPLPVPHSEQLAVLSTSSTDRVQSNNSFSAPMLRSLEKRAALPGASFQQLAGFSQRLVQVQGSAGKVQVSGELVSGQFFPMLQTPPILGRYLTPQDDLAGNPQGYAVVLSEGFWRSWFNAAPDVAGRTIVIANVPFTVAGVMPGKFIGASPTERPEIYLPIAAEPIVDAPYNSIADGYRSFWIRIMGRLTSGVSLVQANAALQAASTQILEESVPSGDSLKHEKEHHFALSAESGSKGFTYLRSMFEKPLVAVFALCGAVLLLACLNLTSLLLARAASRERELATRLAIGASRSRLIQQLLLESLLIAVFGTAAGLTLSPLVSHALASMLLNDRPGIALDTSLDLRVYLFAAAITGITAVLIGIVPALRATSGDLNEQIKHGAYARTSRQRQPIFYRLLPRLLMGSEVTLALLLVFGAGLLATSLVRLYRTGLGFEPRGLVNLDLDMDKQPLKGPELVRWYQSFGETLAQQPGVDSVSFDSITPLAGSVEAYSFKTPLSNGDQQVDGNDVAPNYFQTMRIPLLQGRDFSWNDTESSGLKIILNETAARTLFPGRSAIGQSVPNGKKSYEVIGVVGDIHYLSVRDEAPPGAYFPITQRGPDDKSSYTAVARLRGSATPFAAAARRLALQMAPDIPAPVMTTMSSTLDDSISSERMMALLSVFFAACALLVTAIGLYGTLAYATARRTSEIGIRMALGAQRLGVVALVFRENAWVSICGCAAGLVAALLASKALASFLYSTSARDPWVLAGSVLALIAIASAASLLPAIRAARIEPIEALRTE
jgi:predicted permease